MVLTTILGIAACITCAAGGFAVLSEVNDASYDSHMIEVLKKQELANDSTKEEREALANALNEMCAKKDEILKNEERVRNDIVNDYFLANHFREQEKAAKDAVVLAVDQYKESTNYDTKLSTLKYEKIERMEAYKNSSKYDYELAKAKKHIEDLKENHKQAMRQLNLMPDDDILAPIKEQTESTYKSKMKEAEEALKKIKDEYDIESKLVNADVDKKIAELESEIKAVQKREQDKCDSVISDINSKIREKSAEVSRQIAKNRSDDDNFVLDEYERLSDEMKNTDHNILSNAKDALKKLTLTDRIALDLQSRGVSATEAGIVGVLPILPIIYGIVRYILSLVKVVRRLA